MTQIILRYLFLITVFFIGCETQKLPHPSIGKLVGQLPAVSVSNPSQASPTLEGRITLLNFWATWCPPCRRELPGLSRLATRLADEPRFQLVAIACDQERPDTLIPYVNEFLEGQRIHIDAWIDPNASLQKIFSQDFGFTSLPTSYLIGIDGRIQKVWIGYNRGDESEMAQAIVYALKNSALQTQAERAD